MNTQLDASRISMKRLHCQRGCALRQAEQMYGGTEMDKIIVKMNSRSAINGIRDIRQTDHITLVYAGTRILHG